ncbi:HNH endonuclease signature motif containing protein, partial [Nocardiopsis coralli]|uniref:HNH endonuclease signature motif containing protein n=1 Tax=Nocardiopsis coralli TaxID=2772213 RepID=UPI002E2A1F69
GFTFQAWGPASDGERLKAALASFTAPYGTTEKTPGGADGTNGTGADLGLIPAGESVTSRYARTYDALISAAGFAHGHHGHTDGTGFAGTTTAAAAAGGDAGTEAGADSVGHADGAGAGAGSGGSAEAAATGASNGGGCSQPPGTKAVINITVPLSALLGFGFAFKNQNETDTGNDANGVAYPAAGAAGAATAGGTNTTGATGNTGASAAPGPEPGAEPGPDPGGGTGGGVTTTATATAGGTNANTGPPSTVPGFPGYPGVAVTEDGNVLALSAVRAMAPTAQIRRLIFDDRTGLPLDLGRAHRLAPGYLRTAAFAGHTTCAWSGGCDVPVSQCEADHITEFSHGGETKATNLQPLCSTHNRAKYRHSRTENTPTNGTGGTGGGAHGGSGAEATGTTDTGTG